MDFASHLKSQLDIVEVVGQYVRLKRAGAGPRYEGLCPFHNEKTPSFGVHSVHQYYKCFGCDAKGDVFKFVMDIDGLTFFEALKVLSERYGIPMPQRRADDPAAQRRETLLEMHEIAARLFEDNLQSAAGAGARDYLKRRGLSSDAIRDFRLGVSDARGQQLAQRLQKFGTDLLEESGLVSRRSEGGGFYDRFRGRLMFPIHDESGKVIAFGGRALGADDQPKYLNSPETKIYKKSYVLYNLHRAKTAARKSDRMILVEGYMDVIGVYQSGRHNVVASCGTSLTGEQVRAIKRQIAHTEASSGQVIVNFDPDNAGTQATERSIQMLLAEGLRVKVLTLSNGQDPDEFVQEHGAEHYHQAVQSAPSYFRWLADRARAKFDMQDAEGRVQAFQFLWPALQKVHDRLERASLVNEISSYLGIDPQVIREQFRRAAPEGVAAKRVVELTSVIPPNEKLLLSCMLQDEQARLAAIHFLMQSGIPDNLQLKAAFEMMIRMQEEGVSFSFDTLVERLEPRLQRILTELTFQDGHVPLESSTNQALQCLRALESKTAETSRARIRRRIQEAEHNGNLKEALQLYEELKKMDDSDRHQGIL